MKVMYTLKAKTAEGFGGKDVYEEIVPIEQDGGDEAMLKAKREFALKYGVMLDMVTVE